MVVEIKKVGVIGSGQMGSGIAHVCAVAGYNVALSDISMDRIESGLASINGNMARQVQKGQLSPRPLVGVSSGDAASIRGPGISPALIALRMTISSRALAAAALLILVKPWSRSSFTCFMVIKVCSSMGTSPSASKVEVLPKLG